MATVVTDHNYKFLHKLNFQNSICVSFYVHTFIDDQWPVMLFRHSEVH